MKKLTVLLATLLFVPSLEAGSDPVTPPVMTEPLASGEGWWFRAAPYGWLAAVEGDVAIGSLSAPLDTSMSDSLGDLDMALMGIFEVGYNRWALGVDLVYAKLSQDIDGGGFLFDSYRYEQKQWLVTPVLSYRLIESEGYQMSVLAGARITVLEADLTGRFAAGGEVARGTDTSWADPVVGVRGQADFGNGWFFRYACDVGGFGVSSDLVWQAYAGLGYNFNKYCAISLGYRGLGVDYTDGPLTLDSISHGPVLGLEFRF